jgi:hypothetical protein
MSKLFGAKSASTAIVTSFPTTHPELISIDKALGIIRNDG